MPRADFKSVDEYIATQPKSSQKTLTQVRSAIRKALPKAVEVISYKIPTYKLRDEAVIYFAGWKHHYSLYPAGARLAGAFAEDLDAYKVVNSTIRFPLSEAVPAKLIERIAKFRVKELAGREKATPAKKG